MYEHLKKIFTLLPLLFLYLLLQFWLQSGKNSKALALEVPKNIGIHEELMEMIDQLEKDITRRLNYEVELERDPLNLNTIVKTKTLAKGKKEFTEQQSVLRLSGTIISPKNSRAVIKHRSKSYVLGIGDTILGKEVIAIEKKRVVLAENGTKTILINRPAPKIEKVYDSQKNYSEDLKL